MTEYLDPDDLLTIAQYAVDGDVAVRDHGLLASAAARPQASAFGADAYPELHLKAAALLHSLARNHPLVDGNKRLAWLATYVFLDINGQGPFATQDDVFDLVLAVASGTLDDLEKIAAQLAAWSPGV
ncbi:type II toxin-antitoxin system death-on-curing family toxin [Pseudonocardia sp. DLS-67]